MAFFARLTTDEKTVRSDEADKHEAYECRECGESMHIIKAAQRPYLSGTVVNAPRHFSHPSDGGKGGGSDCGVVSPTVTRR